MQVALTLLLQYGIRIVFLFVGEVANMCLCRSIEGGWELGTSRDIEEWCLCLRACGGSCSVSCRCV